MASSTAVIASNTGAVPELVHPDHNGLLYEVGDVTTLSEGVCSLLADPKKRERLGAQAREDIAAKFDVASVPEKYRKLWDKLLLSKK